MAHMAGDTDRPQQETTDPATVSYLLRAIPADLWEAVKDRARREGLSLRTVLILSLRAYVRRGLRD